MNTRYLRLIGLLLAMAVPLLASAQPYPGKSIRMIVPYAAGTAADALARILGDRLAQALGQPVVVDDRPGAGGNIGVEAAAKAPNDGRDAHARRVRGPRQGRRGAVGGDREKDGHPRRLTLALFVAGSGVGLVDQALR